MDTVVEPKEWKSPDGISVENQIRKLDELSFEFKNLSLVKVDLNCGLIYCMQSIESPPVIFKIVADLAAIKANTTFIHHTLEEPMRFCIQQDTGHKHRDVYLEMSLPGYNGLKLIKNADFRYKIYYGFPRRLIIRRTIVKLDALQENINLLMAEANNMLNQYCDEPTK